MSGVTMNKNLLTFAEYIVYKPKTDAENFVRNHFRVVNINQIQRHLVAVAGVQIILSVRRSETGVPEHLSVTVNSIFATSENCVSALFRFSDIGVRAEPKIFNYLFQGDLLRQFGVLRLAVLSDKFFLRQES